jgi:hypothetical protein
MRSEKLPVKDGELIAEYQLPSGIWVYIKHGVKWIHSKKGFNYSCWSGGGGLGDFTLGWLGGFVAGIAVALAIWGLCG